MKFQMCVFAFIIFIAGCRRATDPTPQPSASIEQSKKDDLFFHEYQPQDPYLRIEGYDFKIKEAWTELTHQETTWGIIRGKGYDFVMTFEDNPDTLNFQSYTKTFSYGSHKIWFFLTHDKYKEDTLILKYADRSTTKDKDTLILEYTPKAIPENIKIFKLFKKL